ncbi:MAG: DUF192 domain-containing protein [Armatimonadota bacterium]
MSGERVYRLRGPRGVLAERLYRPGPGLAWALGLLARPPLKPGEGLWLVPGGSIHTWGLRYAIDVLFLDRDLRVLRVARGVRPWRVALAPRGTAGVVELPAGAAPAEAGDRLTIEPAVAGP